MSKSEVELRKQAELRIWHDRMEALKQAGLMPELTESVIGLIQEKVATLEQEKVEEQSSNLPEPKIQISQSGSPPEGSSKIKMAQQVQREDAPAPSSNPMVDFLADLSAQQAPSLPELPKAPEQTKPTAAVAAKEPTEPVPEAKSAIPSAAVQGTEPLPLAEPPQLDEPKINFNAPDATGPIQSGRQEYEVPIRTGRQPYDVPINSGRQPYEVPKRDPEDQPIVSGRQPYDVPRRDVPEQKIERVVEPLESPGLSTGTDNVKQAADTLNVGGSALMEQAALPASPQKTTAASPTPSTEAPKAKERLEDRREKALQSKPVSPDRLEPGMLERYRQIQSQQAFRDDSSLRIGGGLFPNATPGGNQISVSTQQDKLGIATETANSQLGALLERLAREHANLVVHIREANRILDESQY